MSTADNFITEIFDFFKSSQFVRYVVDIIIQVVADALGLNFFIYQNNNGCLEVLKICGRVLSKDICVKFTHNNKHNIGNHYKPIVKRVGNQEMKQNAEVKIENEEETSNQEEQKYQPSIQDEPSMVHEASIRDELSMVGEGSIKDEPSVVGEGSLKDEPSILGEASIHDEPSIPENIPTPTSYARNYQYEDASIPTEEEGPLDLTMKQKTTITNNTTYSTANRKKKKNMKPKRCWINIYKRRN